MTVPTIGPMTAFTMLATAATAQIEFVDVAPSIGLTHTVQSGEAFPLLDQSLFQTNMGYGGAAGDYDDDGDIDIFLVGGGSVPNRLFRNNVDQGLPGYTDVTDTLMPGLDFPDFARMAHFVDLDNDELLDLVVIADHDMPHASLSKSRVFRNTGDGFVDMTPNSNFLTPGYLRAGASLADQNGDGFLDVYVSAWTLEIGSGEPQYTHAGVPFYNLYYENDARDGFTFTDRTFERGFGLIARDSFTSIFADFDHNSEPDLFVAIDHSSDAFFSNEGGTSTDTTVLVKTTHTGNDMGAAAADFDDDGDLDIYTTNITDNTTDPCGVGTTQGNVLYVNQLSETGSLSFNDEAAQRGVLDTAWGWGVDWIDFENDGDLDLVAATGFRQWLEQILGTDCAISITPTYSFVNDGSGQFARATGIGLDTPEDSRGLLVFDHDRDGDQDILIVNIDEPVRLYENRTTNPGNWLTIDVRQRDGLNRMGIGVRVDALVGGIWKRRDILAGESYVFGSPPEVHFGLGPHAAADALRVRWTDGTITTLGPVPANQYRRVNQPACPCDVNNDSAADILDLLEFVSVWYSRDALADFNADNSTDVIDLLTFLECFLGPC